MSLDYSIFLRSDCAGYNDLINSLLIISDLSHDTALRIEGLIDVTCKQLTQHQRKVMLEEYGDFGMDVNWEIAGTHDKVTDIFSTIESLYRCTAQFVNANPDSNCSLMRNGESFYVFNTRNQLILSPIYIESIPVINTLFKKSFVVREITY